MRTLAAPLLTAPLLATALLAAAPAPLTEPVLPQPTDSGLAVTLQIFATLPRHNGSTARPQLLIPAPDGTTDLFAVDEWGVIYRISATGASVTPYLDLTAQPISLIASGGEEGLVGLAFHPNFAGDPQKPGYGKFYTAFSANRASGTPDFLANDDGDHHQVIREWTATVPTAAAFAGTSREILRVGKFASNHNGGDIGFNPNAAPGSADYGNLYIGFGDGGGGNDPRGYAQNLQAPLGKILRINPLTGTGTAQYGIPADNPFTTGSLAAPLVWAYGFRNPQQFGWERGRLGRLFIDDIGQNQVEEVDIGVRGGNFGWQNREGAFATGQAVGSAGGKSDYAVYPRPATDGAATYIYPFAAFDHSDAAEDGGTVSAAIGSGALYQGSAVAALRGTYVFTDFVQGHLFVVTPPTGFSRGTKPVKYVTMQYAGVDYESLSASPIGEGSRSDLRLGTDAAGELYALLKGPGAIYKIVSHP